MRRKIVMLMNGVMQTREFWFCFGLFTASILFGLTDTVDHIYGRQIVRDFILIALPVGILCGLLYQRVVR